MTSGRAIQKIENIVEVQESETKTMWEYNEVVWTCEETKTKLLGKTNSGDGTAWEKKRKKTNAEKNGLCQQRHESYPDDRT